MSLSNNLSNYVAYIFTYSIVTRWEPGCAVLKKVIVQTSAASRELMLIQLLNKQQISACGASLHYYPKENCRRAAALGITEITNKTL